MGIGKWIGGIIGFMALGPLGALAGIVFGSLFDEGINPAEEVMKVTPPRKTDIRASETASFSPCS